MREPYFCAVDRAITGALDNCEDVMVFWVEEDALKGSLFVYLFVLAAGLTLKPQHAAGRSVGSRNLGSLLTCMPWREFDMVREWLRMVSVLVLGYWAAGWVVNTEGVWVVCM